MNEEAFDKTTPFDHMICSRQLQMLKAAIPYMAPSTRLMFSFYVKTLELHNTLQLFSPKNSEETLSICSIPEGSNQMQEMISAIKEYCTPKEAENLDLFSNLFSAFRLQNRLQSEQKEGADNTGSGFDLSTLLLNFLTPEQKSMFDMLNV